MEKWTLAIKELPQMLMAAGIVMEERWISVIEERIRILPEKHTI